MQRRGSLSTQAHMDLRVTTRCCQRAGTRAARVCLHGRSRSAPVRRIWCVDARVRRQDSSCLGGKRGQVHPEEGDRGEGGESLSARRRMSQVHVRMRARGWC